ncbi:hypothetical protein [Neisseria weaveri]|uniref:Uncharacterized protein n=1 Tax=Neisseria weaveri TaxID=28091 RepID=A0A448VL91_9NEIS|nr:hypothetical protein [Neisseria weaveri]EGV36089.1 hypothetical protein l13_11130 [Neisseria weaveri ATCC 51223]EGV38737.1 hypothetical protein l11_01840 [Neisseria weaveri LMG 5135]VEJ50521.1 Uncharacterised protein [Neisseria weaveri]
MLNRFVPIFAVIGFLSTIGYLGLIFWTVYSRLKKYRHPAVYNRINNKTH